jgi:Uma2 family endonuclease
VELRSPSDDPRDLQKKMQAYLDNGLQLGWLVDPETQMVEIYRTNQVVEILVNPDRLSGEEILPGFILDLNGIL